MEFKKIKLKDISVRITKGTTPEKEAFKGKDVIYIKSDSLNYHGFMDETAFVTIDQKTHESKLKRSILRENDILYSIAGAYLGKIGLVKKEYLPANTNQAVGIISIDYNLALPKYVYYYLQQLKVRYYANNSIAQSAQPNINLEQLGQFDIALCEMEEQNKIVNILDSINKKIELNNQINDNLLEMSQLIFSNYINENKSINYCKIKDLNPKLETGKRPNGGVGNILNGIPSIGAESIKKVGYFDYSKTKYVTEEYFEKMKKGIVKGYEILIYKDGGKPGYFMPNFSMFGEGFPYERCAINEHVFLLDFNNIRFNIFYYYYFNSEEIRHKLHVLGSKSAAIPGINQQDILNLEIPCVKEKDAYELFDILEFNTKMIIKNSKQNHKLCQLRDTLLPKLMNGEINLSNVNI